MERKAGKEIRETKEIKEYLVWMRLVPLEQMDYHYLDAAGDRLK